MYPRGRQTPTSVSLWLIFEASGPGGSLKRYCARNSFRRSRGE